MNALVPILDKPFQPLHTEICTHTCQKVLSRSSSRHRFSRWSRRLRDAQAVFISSLRMMTPTDGGGAPGVGSSDVGGGVCGLVATGTQL